MITQFRTRFNRAPVSGVRFDKPSLVQPQFKQASDINVMIKRALGGDMSVFRSRGNMVDASEAPESYHDAMNIITRAEQAWESLPDAVKRAYGNAVNFMHEYEKALTNPSSEPVEAPAKSDKIPESQPSGPEASTPKSAPNT